MDGALRRSVTVVSGEPTTRECIAALIEFGIVLRDLAVILGQTSCAARAGYALQRLDHIVRKDHANDSP